MTAIAGWAADRSETQLHAAVTAILEALAAFSRSPIRTSADIGVAFGTALFPLLPEDQFDCQPVRFGNNLLVADARIDNRAELAANIGLGPAEADRLADSGLIARAWEKWGEDSLDRMVGDFAIAVYSSKDATLALARDVTGQRPLFFADRGQSISFASMPAGLLALEANRQGLDLRAIARALTDAPPDPEESYFQGIRRVPPGQIVKWRRGTIGSRVFWEPRRSELILASDHEYVAAYRDVLDTAVAARMRTNADALAVQLSSGYDSNSIAGTAARLRPDNNLIALTAAPRHGFAGAMPRHRIGDESHLARLAADSHGIEHVIYRFHEPALAHLRGQEAFYQDPFRNIVNSGWITALEQIAAERGANVMLAGDLGNLTLNSGGIGVLAEWIGRGHWRKWWHEASLAARSEDVRWRGILVNSFNPWLPGAASAAMYRLFRKPMRRPDLNFVNDRWKSKLKSYSPPDPPASGNSAVDRWNRLRTFDFGTIRKGGLGLTGVDTRDVMSDRRIIEFSFALPPGQRFSDGLPRPLARQALSDRVPAEILGARKRGLQSADWYERSSIRDCMALADEISASDAARELIDFDALRLAIGRWPTAHFERFSTYQIYAHQIPLTLATGLFLLHFERLAAAR